MSAARRRTHANSEELDDTIEAARTHPKEPGLRLKLARLYRDGGINAKAINQYQVYLSLKVSATKELKDHTDRLTAAGHLPDMSLFNAMVAASVKLRG